MGAGSHHHVAFRVRDDAEEVEYQQAHPSGRLQRHPGVRAPILPFDLLARAGRRAYSDRYNPPGFTWDETVEQLGSGLKLPPWLEQQRDVIQRTLLPISV